MKGRGIIYGESDNDMPPTLDGMLVEDFVRCEREYRVYCGRRRGCSDIEILHIDCKIVREGHDGCLIRNARTSRFVSSRNNKVLNGYAVKRQSISASEAVGLNLAAVDVGVDSDGRAWVFETNTKPGFENTPARQHVKEIWESVRND